MGIKVQGTFLTMGNAGFISAAVCPQKPCSEWALVPHTRLLGGQSTSSVGSVLKLAMLRG